MFSVMDSLIGEYTDAMNIGVSHLLQTSCLAGSVAELVGSF